MWSFETHLLRARAEAALVTVNAAGAPETVPRMLAVDTAPIEVITIRISMRFRFIIKTSSKARIVSPVIFISVISEERRNTRSKNEHSHPYPRGKWLHCVPGRKKTVPNFRLAFRLITRLRSFCSLFTVRKLTFLQTQSEYSRSRPTSYSESVLGKPTGCSPDLKTSPTALNPQNDLTAHWFYLNGPC